MQIILREEVLNLGDAGTVVNVRDGYARNYLLPRKLAVVADPNNLKALEHERRQIAAKQGRVKTAAEAVAKQLKGLSLEFQREVGEEGKLFGSVTASEIAEAIQACGVTIDRRRLRLGEPIKHVGDFPIEIRLHPEVLATITVKVLSTTPTTEEQK